jgi:FKBP-type peptidyl-prolyl cis-trans isomerase
VPSFLYLDTPIFRCTMPQTIRDTAATDDDAAAAARIVVQPQDVVRIEIVGRLCPTKEDAAAVTTLTSATDGMQQEQERYSPIFIRASNWVIQIGAKDVVPAIEMGVRFMKVGQTALVWSHSKYAYGYGTRRHRLNNNIKNGDGSNGDGNKSSCYYYELPPNSNVCFEITVHQVYADEEESNDATFLARSRKAIANDVYAHEWQDSFSGGQGKQRAIYLYQKVAKDLLQVVQEEDENSDKSTTTTRRDEALTLLLDCLNNIVAVYLRAHEYHAAKLAAVRVLEVDPNNLKALLRAAQASLLDPASSYEEVQASLQAATERLQQSILVNNSDNNSDSSDIEKHHQTTTVPPAELKKHQADLRRLKVDFIKRQYEYKQKSRAMFSKALLGEGGRGHATMTTAATTENVTTTTSPKDKPPLVTTTTETMEDDQDDAAAADIDLVWYKKLPWRAQILPLLLQMILPFVMWYFVHCYRRPLRIHDAKASLENDMRTSSSSHSSSTHGTSNEF